MFVCVARTPGMELQRITVHLVARSSRAIACNAARDCELLLFMFRPDTYVMQGTYTMVFLHQESIPGVIVALKHPLGLFFDDIAVIRC
jgi:hypothetical protein